MYKKGSFPTQLSGEVDAVCGLTLAQVEHLLGPSEIFEDDSNVVVSPTHFWAFRNEQGEEVVVAVLSHPTFDNCHIIAGGIDVTAFMLSVGFPLDSVTWLRSERGEPRTRTKG